MRYKKFTKMTFKNKISRFDKIRNLGEILVCLSEKISCGILRVFKE